MTKVTDSNRIGDIAEFYAVTWFWDQGYEVFLNPGSSGMADMVIYKDGKMTLIDIKHLMRDPRKDNWYVKDVRTPKQKEHGVQLVGFHPDTRKCRFVEHKE
jgi:Holliday junction resolvase